jgi:Cys-tRNA(Pro)/Cys-tRNA(Cys) deacylase
VPCGRQIDWKRLRTHLGQRRLAQPDADEARAATGYERGAITPFGATTAWPVVADATIRGLGTVAIGAGARGVNLHVEAETMLEALHATEADVTSPAAPRDDA